MCGRYIIRQQAKALREGERYGTPPFVEYNVAPTQQVPIVRLRDDAPEFASVRWGLVPFFTRGAPAPYSTINARLETFETAASYRAPWRRGQRCLQLASGFYEWHLDSHGRKAPYLITVADQALFAFAALWECSRRDDGSVVESCAHHDARERVTGGHPHWGQPAADAGHRVPRGPGYLARGTPRRRARTTIPGGSHGPSRFRRVNA
jgi:putative SOS response-associated peptidase YedK